jgi:hypothetical protein
MAEVVFNQVVTEDDTNRFPVCKVFGQTKSLGNPAFALLVGIIQMLQSEVVAVAEEA